MFLKKLTHLSILILFIVSVGCKKYVEVDLAPNLLEKDKAFLTDNSATSATLALYSYYVTVNALQYQTIIGGLSADELQFTASDANLIQFSQNVVANSNGYVNSQLWALPYQVIRETNLIIDGVTKSTTITSSVKSQLVGEAKFFRALMFFNLTNYFGGVPLTLDPIEVNNAFLGRASTQEVYAQILKDLQDAQTLLPTTYAGTASSKVRVNKWAATALLAKVYLYNKDYTNAETEATKVINSGTYSMATLANAFINTSSETILQLYTLYGASAFSGIYRTTSSANNVAPPSYVLYNDFTKGFESGDNRKTSWVDSTTVNTVKYYRVNKYKVATAAATTLGNEYTVLLRLAELYLIRAEARAQQSNIAGAQSDINVIRTRAGLGNTTATTQSTLLSAIAKERKLELFGEYANRWYDLKRTNTADAILTPLKTSYKSTAQLMPIPVDQILLNANLTQNPGY